MYPGFARRNAVKYLFGSEALKNDRFLREGEKK